MMQQDGFVVQPAMNSFIGGEGAERDSRQTGIHNSSRLSWRAGMNVWPSDTREMEKMHDSAASKKGGGVDSGD
jgi:hypothetical protein